MVSFGVTAKRHRSEQTNSHTLREYATRTHLPDVLGPVPRPIICPMAAPSHRIFQLTVPVTIPGPVTLAEAVPVPRNRHPAVPRPVPGHATHLVIFLTCQTLRPPSLVSRSESSPSLRVPSAHCFVKISELM